MKKLELIAILNSFDENPEIIIRAGKMESLYSVQTVSAINIFPGEYEDKKGAWIKPHREHTLTDAGEVLPALLLDIAR